MGNYDAEKIKNIAKCLAGIAVKDSYSLLLTGLGQHGDELNKGRENSTCSGYG